jgi:hypothetical protein
VLHAGDPALGGERVREEKRRGREKGKSREVMNADRQTETGRETHAHRQRGWWTGGR